MSSPRLSNSRKRRICLDSSDSDSDDELPFKIKRGREPTIAAHLRHFFRWCTEKYSASVKEYFSSVMRMGSPMMDTVIVDDDDNKQEEDEVVVLDEVKKSGKPNPFYDRVKNRHAFINRAIRRQNYDFSEPVLYAKNMLGNRLSSNNVEKDLSSRLHALQTEASSSCFAVEKTLNGSPPSNGIQGHFTSSDQRNGASKVRSQISNPETDIQILLESFEKPPAETDEIQVLSEIPVSKYRSSFKKMPCSKTVHTICKSSHSQINDVCNEKGAEITLSEGENRQAPSLFKQYTANEVIKLQEKTKYQQLLNTYFKSQCYHPIKKPTQSVEVQTDSSSDEPIFLKSLKDVRKQPVDSFIQEHYKPNDYGHRLSSGKPTRQHKRIELPDETLDILDLDNDLQIMEVQLPKYKLRFDSKPDLSDPMWLSQFRIQICAETEERRKIEAEQTRRLEILKQQRLNKDVKETIEFIRGRALREIETPELTPEMEAFIEKGLRCSPDKLINQLGLCEIRRRDVETIISYSWLNDEVINYYLNLIVHRNKEEGLPSVYAFTTFFYPVLKSRGYQNVRKWTRKVDIFSHDILLMPLHLGVHWALVVIYPEKKKIEYYDSMGKTEIQCFDYVNSYLEQEFRDKKGGEFSGEYRTERMDVPQQMNGSDCGMFTLKYSEYVARNAKINFEQENMPYFRRKMVYEMMTNRII